MSESDNDVPEHGSEEPSLVEIGSYHFVVRDHSIHILAVNEHGRRFRLGAVGPGFAVGPVHGGPKLFAVKHPGAQLQHLEPGQLGPQALTSWRRLLSRAIHDEEAQQAIEQTDNEALGQVAGRYLHQELQRRSDSDLQSLLARIELDRESTSLTGDRSIQTIRTPNVPLPPASRSVLFSCMNEIGDAQGFKALDGKPAAASGAAAVDAMAHAAKVRRRAVRLESGWIYNPLSPMLAFIGTAEEVDEGTAEPVALIPKRGKYHVYRPAKIDMHPKLTPQLAEQIDPVAWEFVIPFADDREVRWRDISKLALRGFGGAWAWITFAALAVSVLALVGPALTQQVMSAIVPAGNVGLLMAIGVALAIAAIISACYAVVQSLTLARITQQSQLRVQAAVWDRTLSLPATFFAKYPSGDLMGRVLAATNSGQIVSTAMISQVLGSLFSLISFVLLFHYSVVLSLVTIGVLLITLVVMLVFGRQMYGLSKGMVSSQRIATMWMVQVLSGITKIRTSGAEDRLVAQHQERMRGLVNYSARQTLVMRRLSSFNVSISAIMPALTYAAVLLFAWGPAGAEITAPTYMAFVATYGVVYGGISALSSTILPAANSRSTLKLAEPILKTLPESFVGSDRLGKMHGSIELTSVSFRYEEKSPVVLDGISLKIEPGEFIAVVGSSGSGKSTLVRLLLGFERPTDGQVLIDGRDLNDLDLKDYRSHLGVVLQSGQLLQGSLRENILAGLPLPDSDVVAAAKLAALADDINAMPMGLSTLVDSSTVSGGQAQRILLARTLIRKPQVIILDEATSAMDNTSQAEVTRVLDHIEATRIVVAHRLSTIASADRILVLEAGQIVEEGTFSELLAADGAFAKLASAQLLDVKSTLVEAKPG